MSRLTRTTSTVFAVALLAGCSGPDAGGPPLDPPRPNRTSRLLEQVAKRSYLPENRDRPVEIAVAQDGQQLQVIARTVSLAPRPFDLLLTFYNGRGVLVDFSVSPKLFQMAVSGASLADPFHGGTGLAEHLRNPEKMVMLGDDFQGHHYWFYDPKTREHRCDRVQPVDGAYVCRRRVARMFHQGTKKTAPVADFASRTVHVVLYQKAGSRELARQALRLAFRAQ